MLRQDFLGRFLFAASVAALWCATASAVPQADPAAKLEKRLVITVDDLPGPKPGTDKGNTHLADLQRYNQTIPAVLKAHHVPAVGFVNEGKLQVQGERDARVALLESWVNAGLELGNHTYSHKNMDSLRVEEFEDETVRGDPVTRLLMASVGKKNRYFRHPFLSAGEKAESKAVFEAFLKSRGYTVAPVTVDASDYMFASALFDARTRGDKEAEERCKKDYLEYSRVAFGWSEKQSQDLFGRQIPQILLIHDNEINTAMLDALLTNLEKDGYRFVTMEEALADPAYQTEDKFVSHEGVSWLTRWKLAFGKEPDYKNDPDPPKWIIDKFEEIGRINKANGNI